MRATRSGTSSFSANPPSRYCRSSHRLSRPRAHWWQTPQGAESAQKTTSPGATFVTPSPTLSIVPANSCPSRAGYGPSEGWPRRTDLTSVWQLAAAPIAQHDLAGTGDGLVDLVDPQVAGAVEAARPSRAS